ncbi:MAG: hypothetical protein WA624_10680 [Methylocella sp.]
MSRQEINDTRLAHSRLSGECQFTATLLPLLLFHNNPSGELEGVRRFIDLVEEKATTERNRFGYRETKGTTKYDFQDVEVITEFHIARDLKFGGLPLDVTAWSREEATSAEPMRPREEGEPKKDAPDVVIVAGQELVVCEGKFFNGFNTNYLNEQLRSQRCQVRHLFLNRPSIRAYRHVAIVPPERMDSTTAIDADVVLTWADIRDLAEKLMGAHYVTDRLREAVRRYEDDEDDEGQGIPNWNGKNVLFDAMREKCKTEKIQVGYVGGEAALLKLSLVEAENRKWKWRYPENKGRIIPGNWLPGARWLEMVESTRGFGGGGGGDPG